MALAWGGCASAPTVAVTAPNHAAQIAIANLTDYAWNVTARPAAGGKALVWPVAPRGSVEIELAGGDYIFEQAIVGGSAPVAAAKREFPIRFEPAERYEWSLSTLLSADSAATAQTAIQSAR